MKAHGSKRPSLEVDGMQNEGKGRNGGGQFLRERVVSECTNGMLLLSELMLRLDYRESAYARHLSTLHWRWEGVQGGR